MHHAGPRHAKSQVMLCCAAQVTMPALLPVLSATPGSTRWAGPELGQHTEQILRDELGMGPAEIARLRECGAI
jgi:crotonobetainyl-CoA:carnitine CoA-transferase CaiB-like acyl-CoA transferase